MEICSHKKSRIGPTLGRELDPNGGEASCTLMFSFSQSLFPLSSPSRDYLSPLGHKVEGGWSCLGRRDVEQKDGAPSKIAQQCILSKRTWPSAGQRCESSFASQIPSCLRSRSGIRALLSAPQNSNGLPSACSGVLDAFQPTSGDYTNCQGGHR